MVGRSVGEARPFVGYICAGAAAVIHQKTSEEKRTDSL